MIVDLSLTRVGLFLAATLLACLTLASGQTSDKLTEFDYLLLGLTIRPMLGQAIVLVKDSSLLSLISIMELTRAGQTLTSDRFMPTEGFLTTAAFYLVIYYMLKGFSAWAEKRLIFQEAH